MYQIWYGMHLRLKLKKLLPTSHYMFLISYILNRQFFVKHGERVSNLLGFNAGVPQRSCLGPIINLLFTYGLPMLNNVVIGRTCT